jgi:hypothetical protein
MHVTNLPDTVRPVGLSSTLGCWVEKDKASPILALPVHLRIEIAVIKNDSVGASQAMNG